jgi:hypothetical protein
MAQKIFRFESVGKLEQDDKVKELMQEFIR